MECYKTSCFWIKKHTTYFFTKTKDRLKRLYMRTCNVENRIKVLLVTTVKTICYWSYTFDMYMYI